MRRRGGDGGDPGGAERRRTVNADRPCRGCTERTPTCHAVCRAYLEAAARGEALRQKKRSETDFIQVKRAAIRRVYRRMHGKER